MTDNVIEGPGPGGRIEPVELQTSMQRAYIDYAMAVIVGRALPDVRDGLKPVHRRVLYAMYDGGYRPDRGFSKCSRVVGDVMGQYHPHGDSAIYDTLVRLAQPWVMRAPLIHGQGNFGSPGNDPAAAMRYTECRMAPLAMEMVRDIDKDTVDFQPNYDGRSSEPVILPARFPNLLVNGSAGIAVGMATSIPPHNLREVAEGATWALEHPDATREELLDALLERIKGPDFPNSALIVGRQGIEQTYRTGRGSVTQRAVIDVDEDAKGRTSLIITQLPYMVNPDNLALKIAELADTGKVQGIADVKDNTSSRTGQQLVVVLKRDAVARVVLNNLLKHTELQTNFSANMLALVDGVPRTLTLDQFISHWVAHQIEVIQRRTRFLLADAERRAHIFRGLAKALDMLDEVIALIRRSPEVDDARRGLIELLDIDEIQANAILDMQLRRLAALERQKIIDELVKIETEIADLEDILADPARQRRIICRGAQGGRRQVRQGPAHPDHRRRRRPLDGGPDPRRGPRRDDHPRRLRQAHPRRPVPHPEARRQGRPRRDAEGRRRRRALHGDHQPPLAAVLHHRRPRLPHQGLQPPRGVARRQGRSRRRAAVLPARRADRPGAGDPRLRPGAVPRAGHPQRPGQEDPARRLQQPAPGRRHRDQLPRGRRRADRRRAGQRRRRHPAGLPQGAGDPVPGGRRELRPMGRATSGVTGMKFREGDQLLSMSVIRAEQVAAEEAAAARAAEAGASTEPGDLPGVQEQYVFTITDGGFAKRTRISEYRLQSRGGLGIKAMKQDDDRGNLVGAFIVVEGDEVLAIKQSGQVTRSAIDEHLRPTGRDTKGVRFVGVSEGDGVAQVARSVERATEIEEAVEEAVGDEADVTAEDAAATPSVDRADEADAVTNRDSDQEDATIVTDRPGDEPADDEATTEES